MLVNYYKRCIMVSYNKNQHAVFKLTYHVVLVVKYRRRVITPEIGEYMRQHTDRLLNQKGGSLIEFNYDYDHIHFLMDLPPILAPANVVCSIKTQLSKEIRASFMNEIKNQLWGKAFWSASYFICSTGGVQQLILSKIILNHSKQKNTNVNILNL